MIAFPLAALGDVVILLIGFWIIALTAKSRHWIIDPKIIQVIGYIFIGVVITVVIESIAIQILNRWQYATEVPTLPILGTGIAPILQWLIIPPISVSMMSRKGVGV